MVRSLTVTLVFTSFGVVADECPSFSPLPPGSPTKCELNQLNNDEVANADDVMENFNTLGDAIDATAPPSDCSTDQIIKWSGSAWICSDPSGVPVTFDNGNDNLVAGDGLLNVTPGTPEDYSGKYNTASGASALDANSEGYNNTASGAYALYANTTGQNNTANGVSALGYNTSGNFNTANGSYSLFRNTTGDHNTANGVYALNNNTAGYENTANGAYALTSNTTGNKNTAVGYYSLYSNTTGENNTAVGQESLQNNTDGSQNTAVGTQALRDNTTGTNNTATGFKTLERNTSGSSNTASGWSALPYNTTGYENTAFGFGALLTNTTGYGNIAIGNLALSNNKTGYNNTVIGHGANVTSEDFENATAIGHKAVATGSNSVRIGNASVTVIGGAAAWSNFSDERLKEKVEPVSSGLSLINDLKPVAYHRINNDAPDVEMGLLAQEVAATLLKHGLGNSGMVHQPSEDAYMSLRYNDLLAPMIKAIQELDTQHIAAIDDREEKIASLQGQLKIQNKELLALIQSQQDQIAQLRKMVEHQFATN